MGDVITIGGSPRAPKVTVVTCLLVRMHAACDAARQVSHPEVSGVAVAQLKSAFDGFARLHGLGPACVMGVVAEARGLFAGEGEARPFRELAWDAAQHVVWELREDRSMRWAQILDAALRAIEPPAAA